MTISTLELIHELLKAEAEAAYSESKEAYSAACEAYPDRFPDKYTDPVLVRRDICLKRRYRADDALREFESNEW